jgi:uncharacterized protein YjlB
MVQFKQAIMSVNLLSIHGANVASQNSSAAEEQRTDVPVALKIKMSTKLSGTLWKKHWQIGLYPYGHYKCALIEGIRYSL